MNGFCIGHDPYWRFRGGSAYPRDQRRLSCFSIGLRCLNSGRYRVVGIGHPAYHSDDWRGANAHWLALPGQPGTGFDDVSSALCWLFERHSTEAAALREVDGLGRCGAWTNGNGLLFVDFQARKAT